MKRILFIAALFCAVIAQAQLPAVTLTDIKGNSVKTAEVSNDGKPIIISFFATWCKPCMRELKAIHEVYPDWQDETGVKLIAVSIDQAQDVAKVKPLVEGNGWEYEVWLDPNSDLKRALSIQMIPHVLLLDGSGNIVYQHSGYTDGSEAELFEKIKGIK